MPAKVSAKPTNSTAKGDKKKKKTSTATEWGKPGPIISGARAKKLLEAGHLKIFSIKDATNSANVAVKYYGREQK